MNQKRIKSPMLWGAIGAILMLLLRVFGFEEAAMMASERGGQLFDLLCAILAVLGIVNNPTDRRGF